MWLGTELLVQSHPTSIGSPRQHMRGCLVKQGVMSGALSESPPSSPATISHVNRKLHSYVDQWLISYMPFTANDMITVLKKQSAKYQVVELDLNYK